MDSETNHNFFPKYRITSSLFAYKMFFNKTIFLDFFSPSNVGKNKRWKRWKYDDSLVFHAGYCEKSRMCKVVY